jgi:hypothetical protein
MNIYAERERTRSPSLPSELWRERFLAGWPEAWDSPQAPLQILCWESREGDFRGPEDGAIDAALALASDPYRSGPEGISRIREELARCWTRENDAGKMLDHIARLAFVAGEGSAAHRIATLLACLCARTSPHLPTKSARAIDLTEAWALGGDDRRKEACEMAEAAAYAAADASAYAAATAAYAAADASAYAAATAADYAADASAYADDGGDWNTNSHRHLAALADLVRAAVPKFPF